jgi:hypothetical protein
MMMDEGEISLNEFSSSHFIVDLPYLLQNIFGVALQLFNSRIYYLLVSKSNLDKFKKMKIKNVYSK